MRVTVEVVLEALQSLEADGPGCPSTGDIERRLAQRYPGLVIHQGAVNARLRRLRRMGVVYDVIDARRGVDTIWATYPAPT